MKLKERLSKHPNAVKVGIVLTFLLALAIVAYVTAPSTTNTPKADELDRQSVVLQANANTAETVANVYREQRVEARKETTQAKDTLRQRKQNYEKAHNNNAPVSNTDLDRRERQLQSDLANLYPSNR